MKVMPSIVMFDAGEKSAPLNVTLPLTSPLALPVGAVAPAETSGVITTVDDLLEALNDAVAPRREAEHRARSGA